MGFRIQRFASYIPQFRTLSPQQCSITIATLIYNYICQVGLALVRTLMFRPFRHFIKHVVSRMPEALQPPLMVFLHPKTLLLANKRQYNHK
uniref:Putative ovule protein n=1 Tax=Solanum chacoense TaxID=4108 RepID=A0A0V0H3I0_SOLCH